MATTAANLITASLDLLLGSSRSQVNVLTSTITSSDTTLTFTYASGGIVEGASIEIGSELMRVVSVSGSTAVVIRAQRGSTAAAHTAGDTVTVNPRYSRFAITREMNNDLDDLSAEGLGRFTTVEQTYNAAIAGYDITGATAIDEVVRVSYQDVGPERRWPVLGSSEWDWETRAETDDFASGFSLVLTNGEPAPGRQLRIVYRSPYTRITAETDDAQSTIGLAATQNDLPPLGAALRLLYPHEVQRNQLESQGDTRRPDEVPAGATLGAARGWAEMRAGRIVRELQRQERQIRQVRY